MRLDSIASAEDGRPRSRPCGRQLSDGDGEIQEPAGSTSVKEDRPSGSEVSALF
ncbi:unnamed protein product [Gongylonema pulchrum]|uniref:Uncharacterized protein n=1 Tax=Gongylonema pulchrum TaxID=637853 RepID=A0A183DJV3_9BILA|nr:unnamed protein product [Gongylonema pulchrum]